MARHPWLVVVAWLVMLAAAVPFLLQVTSHLGGGGFSAPNSAAVQADNTASRLVQAHTTPTTMVTGIGWSRLQALAKRTGLPASWLHHLAARAAVLVPGSPTTLAAKFLATVHTAGAQLTTVNSGTLGQAVSQQAIHAFTSSTVVAVPALVILLLLVFGAVLPALLPLITAGVGTILTLAIIAIVARFVPLSVYLLQIVSFLALGTGVDYALFLSTRFRGQLMAGHTLADALAEALRTSGRSVLFSGFAVAMALAALILGGTSYWRGMALGGAIAVGSVLLVTHTLLPALMRLMGPRINTGRIRFAMPDWRLWRVLARWATARPLLSMAVGLGILILPALAVPNIRANLPANVAAMLPTDSLLGRAQAIEQRVDGAGVIAPFIVAIHVVDPLNQAAAWRVVSHIAHDAARIRGVSRVDSPTTYASAAALAAAAQRAPHSLDAFVSGTHEVDLFVVTRSGPDSSKASAVLSTLTTRLARVGGARVDIGGAVAVMNSFDQYLDGRLPAMGLAVLLVAFLVLWAATGSLLQAFAGVVLNGLVSLATAGILVHIIVDGTLGVTAEPLNLAVAPLVFVLLFGLSMDYEVILLHRIQERLRLGDAPRAAAMHAVGTTGGMITGAGLVMVAVVAALLVSPFEMLQTLAIGLVSAVMLDTLVVRTFVVPALVTLAGPHAFWPRRPHHPGPVAPDASSL